MRATPRCWREPSSSLALLPSLRPASRAERTNRALPDQDVGSTSRLVAGTAKPPAVARRGSELARIAIRRSWIEVALPAEHRRPDVLVVEDR